MEATIQTAPSSIRNSANSPPPEPRDCRKSANPRISNPAPNAITVLRGKCLLGIRIEIRKPTVAANCLMQAVARPFTLNRTLRGSVNKISMLLLVIALAGLSGCAHSPRHVNLPSSRNTYDEALLIWLVNYHQEQDRMTGPCAHKDGIRHELRTFCAQSDQQHAERVERLRRWLSDWSGKELPRADPYPLWLASLKGQDFEREFFKEYLEDHDEGIEQTGKCASMATHVELREFCGRINPAQKKTDKQLRAWRCDWFKDCK